ncbi:peptidylprolyl isomerase [Alloalcanivorax xenomutans]|jgi:peptidyl-prolyl cis-trans isomerase SurA|uniref:peptidylprolyl isomerase n=1 Tax=Alloalcanivorax xenomutans TaxID=1094342 RepID=UPI00047C2E09|nr:peptidylprolyl isomerase [Alloalcanivorax xenomutans]KYZ86644.1 molecular chaperone SurA [Alcanivorax sp. KX64203]MBA4722612.1 peptidylprolyl isomerase [Alcanivorax sp.]PHS57585.1 MAG: molecular chaperone SurA [Alcanivorax sp.]CUR46578.1 Survival protein SurA precursor (Peptidyl-prolyl cis-trans isomerase SurA) [Alloalcanivorax xenomutans]
MNRALSTLLTVCLCLGLAVNAQAQVRILDRIVAVVNDGAIMESELQSRVAGIVGQFEADNRPLPPAQVLREQVLDRMIIERIQLQLAERGGIRVDDGSLNQALTGIARQNNMDLEQFANAVRADGYSWAEFREQVRNDMVISRLQQRSVSSRVRVTDREVDRFLSSDLGRRMFAADFHLGHILVQVPSGASPEQLEQARNKANGIVQRLRGGADFAETAVEQSDGPQALEGGDLGWRPAAQWPTLFAETAIDMQPGDISEPLRSGAGYHILKMIERRGGGGEHVVTQYRVRHVLIQSDALTTEDQARAEAQRLHQQVISGSISLADVAREHSDDPGSRNQGGELGWVTPGQMVPEFEQMMESTPVGQVSPVFQTQFGYHFLLVEEQREADMSDEFRQMRARQALQKQRFDEELQTWLQEKRAEAYVDIRLDQ